MSQTMSAAPATRTPSAPQPAGKPQAATGTSGTRSQVSSWFAGTPGRLRAVLVLTAAITVLFGLAAAQGFRQADGALNRAEANTAQLVRIQAIHTNLVSANADATNAFLVGGLEPPAQRQHFTDSMSTASRLVAEAAKAQPADSEALGALNNTLLTYEGLIEQARANNRQGLPIGAQYLKDASAGLQADAIPLLTALVTANENRVNQEFDGASGGSLWLVGAGVVTLLVLAGALVWLAKRTHRYVNLGLAGAGVVVLLTVAVGGSVLSGASGDAKGTRDTSYASTLALSRARIAAYDAKSNESLTLIARGSGASFETAWKTAAGTVGDQLSKAGQSAGSLLQPWSDYANAHQGIRKLDDDGNWDEAVQLAIGSAPASANKTFDSFDQASGQSLSTASTAAQRELHDAGGSLPLLAWLGLPLGLVAALLAWWGLSQRLEEYR
ncbi:MAG TPA: hypothetical protein VGD71_35925 [Kribbella sp.]